MNEDKLITTMRDGVLIAAPVSFFSIPEYELPFYYNGCGAGGIGGILTPDSIYGLNITYQCNIHDHMYERACCEEDEIVADAILTSNLIALIIAKSNTIMAWPRLIRASKYMIAVSATTYSEQFWETNKKESGKQCRYFYPNFLEDLKIKQKQ